MDIVFALDRDRDAMRTYRQNFPEAHFEFADIAAVTAESVRNRGPVSTARQVENAVPVRFAKVVGRQVIRHLHEANAPDTE